MGLVQEYEIEQQFNNLILIISFVKIVDLNLTSKADAKQTS